MKFCMEWANLAGSSTYSQTRKIQSEQWELRMLLVRAVPASVISIAAVDFLAIALLLVGLN